MKPQKNGRQNYDWEKIKLDYISNPALSLRKISDKYHIRLTTVEKRSSADHWHTHLLLIRNIKAWKVIVIWECQLKKDTREQTLEELYLKITE